jgi:hypothetical protein
MTVVSRKMRPPNSVVLISDIELGELPNDLTEGNIWATDSCIGVGCHSEQDGATKFTLGPVSSVDPGHPPAFVGRLQTPSRVLAIHSVELNTILKAPVPRQQIDISIWTNHPTQPDRVWVGFS